MTGLDRALIAGRGFCLLRKHFPSSIRGIRPQASLPFVLLISLISILLAQAAYAGSATWNLDPTNDDWNTAANWSPAIVPNGPSDIATFDVSNTTDVSLTVATEVRGIVFNPGASGFTIKPRPSLDLSISGTGIRNNSGTVQNLIASDDANFSTGQITFSNNATAGDLVTITNEVTSSSHYGGRTLFTDFASASSATLINEGGTSSEQQIAGDFVFIGFSTAANATLINHGSAAAYAFKAEIHFLESSTAANATIENNPGTVPRASGGLVFFADDATGGDATFVNHGSTMADAGAGSMEFYSSSTAGNATLIAEGGTNGGQGAHLLFFQTSSGGTARVEVFGNGYLNIRYRDLPGTTIGSLEGDGSVFLGDNNLTIGSNNRSTTFSGRIQHRGSLTKIGTGNLTLTGANSYSGGTTVDGGILLANNPSGSATGSGLVRVSAGTLGGGGIVVGAVTVGTESGPGAFLGPGKNGVEPGTLTIQKSLKLLADATYKVTMQSSVPSADKVSARGVRISGAQIVFDDRGSSVLPPGTAFTVINNTAATPISGVFSNLANGSTVTVGNNTFQVNYEGGDGNDLTLTVVP